MSSPDPWISSHIHRMREGGDVLDIAAGGGRHSVLARERGCRVTAIDRDVSRLTAPGLHVLQADLEADPWPLTGQDFDGIIVCNYLWRPLFPNILSALRSGGVLIWSTFALGNEAFGRPRNPDFLLRPNELLDVVLPELEVLAFQHGEVETPRAVRQSIVARRPI